MRRRRARATPDDGQYGSVLNAEEFKNSAQALPVEALTEPLAPPIVLPQSAALQNTPAVSMQGTSQSPGSPGTCEAQAFAYGLGSYTAARAPDGSANWDAAQAGNEVSAAYQFALAINNGFATCPKGGQVTQYLSRLSGFGSPSTSDVPYQPSCTYFSQIDLTKAYPDASRLRIGSFATFPINGSASHLPNPGLSRQRAGGRILGPGVPELQQSGDEQRRVLRHGEQHHSQFRPRPVAGRLRQQHRYARQHGRTPRPEQLRHRLAARHVRVARAARQALVVV